MKGQGVLIPAMPSLGNKVISRYLGFSVHFFAIYHFILFMRTKTENGINFQIRQWCVQSWSMEARSGTLILISFKKN